MDYPFYDLPEYRLFVPLQAVGASLVYWDLFNATTTGLDVIVESVTPVVSGATAVTGVVSVDLFLTRTTDVGTGGTAATYNGTSLTACTISAMGSGGGQAVPTGLTARLTPTGGATAGAVLSWCSVFTEETNAASYLGHTNELVRRGIPQNRPLWVNQGTGIRIVQGGTASVGNIGFDVIFRTKQR